MSGSRGPGIAATLAFIRCHHGKLQQQPCGRCVGHALQDVSEYGEPLIEAAARALMQLDGDNTKPTPLTYAAAVALVKDLRPFLAGKTE